MTLRDPFYYSTTPGSQLRKTKSRGNLEPNHLSEGTIKISGVKFVSCTDYLTAIYVQLEAGEGLFEVDTRGKQSLLLDYTPLYEGLYYLGVVQVQDPGNTSNNSEYQSSRRSGTALHDRIGGVKGISNKINLMRKEVLDRGNGYHRVNFISCTYEDNEYLAGDSSTDKVAWMKISLKKDQKNLLFINFSKPVQKFYLWTQGPAVIDFIPKTIERQDVARLKNIFCKFVHPSHFSTCLYSGSILKMGFKILSSGFGFFVVKNNGNFGVMAHLRLKNFKNIVLMSKHDFTPF